MQEDMEYILGCIDQEEERQQQEIQLIASENYVSRAVRYVMSSRLTNRYSEGYPGYKYYGGQAILERIENKAIDLAKELFHADHANVQPHSGAQANNAVYNAWCEPGDKILSLALSDGGHLTHGAPVTQAAKLYDFHFYGLDADGYISYQDIADKLAELHPKILLIGYSAYTRIPDFQRIADLAREISPETLLMADMAHVAGLIAGGVHPNPLDYGFHVMTTTTHKTLRGPRGGMILSMGKVGNPLKKPEKTIENIPTLIDRSVFPGTQGGPLMHVVAAKAIALAEASSPEFAEYAQQVVTNAQAMAKYLVEQGVVMQTGGTDNHCLLINAKQSYGLSGKEAEQILESVGIIVNKNSIHGDTGTKANPDGIRLGTPAMTTRGMEIDESRILAKIIDDVLRNPKDDSLLENARNKVRDLTSWFLVP